MLHMFRRSFSGLGRSTCEDIRKCLHGKWRSVETSQLTLLRRNYNKNIQPNISASRQKLNTHFGQFSTLQTSYELAGKPVTESEQKEFADVFEDVVRDLVTKAEYQDSFEAAGWMGKVLKYNVPSGYITRGQGLVRAYKILASEQEKTPENIRLSIIMAACVEMYESTILMIDDLMDGSTERKKRPCWNIVNNIGVRAANDAVIVENAIYQILKRYFSDKPYYLDAVELFHEAVLETSLGQVLDVNVAADGAEEIPHLNTYSMERYRSIVKYKSGHFGCRLPFTLAMYMAGLKEEIIRQCNKILAEISFVSQAQNDYLDCFEDPTVYGKLGSDIETRKCTWLIATAMQRATPEQKLVLSECYGHKDPLKVAKVKEVYEQLQLRSVYADFLQDRYEVINTLIDQLSYDLPAELFYNFMSQ